MGSIGQLSRGIGQLSWAKTPSLTIIQSMQPDYVGQGPCRLSGARARWWQKTGLSTSHLDLFFK